MQSAGSAENLLRRPQSWRQLAEQFRVEKRSSLGAAEASTPELRYGSFSAHAAGGSGGKSARSAVRLEAYARIEGYPDEILLRRFIAWRPQRDQVFSSGDNAFSE